MKHIITLLTVLCMTSACAQQSHIEQGEKDYSSQCDLLQIFKNDEVSEVQKKLIYKKYPQVDLNKDKKFSDTELQLVASKISPRMQEKVCIQLKSMTEQKEDKEKVSSEVMLDILYKETPRDEGRFDLMPATTQKYDKQPVFVFIHGGGYVGGDKSKIATSPHIVEKLNDEGIAVISLNYRLGGKEIPVYIDEINTDIKDAMRFIAKNADTWDLDPQRMITWGKSAGGSLAMVAALTNHTYLPGAVSSEGAEHTVLGSINYFGATSFVEESVWENRTKDSKEDLFTAHNGWSEEEIRMATSPDVLVEADSAPMLLIYGDKDTTVPVENGRHMNQVAQEKGADVRYIEVKNAGHGFGSVGGKASITKTEIDQILIDQVLEWIEKSYK